MIDKKIFSSIIDKYYLNGLCPSVKWKTDNNVLNIDFYSENGDLVGKLVSSDFPLEDSEIAIFDTEALTRQLRITSGNIDLNLNKTQNVFTKLLISDMNYDLHFSLADPFTIKQVPQVNEDIKFNVEILLESETINSLIKAKNALPKINTVTILPTINDVGESLMKIVFGETADYSNKITYSIEIDKIEGVPNSLTFNSDTLKEILEANKNAEHAKMYVSYDGLLKFEFIEEETHTSYFIAMKGEE